MSVTGPGSRWRGNNAGVSSRPLGGSREAIYTACCRGRLSGLSEMWVRLALEPSPPCVSCQNQHQPILQRQCQTSPSPNALLDRPHHTPSLPGSLLTQLPLLLQLPACHLCLRNYGCTNGKRPTSMSSLRAETDLSVLEGHPERCSGLKPAAIPA